jgi:hypothetical protein
MDYMGAAEFEWGALPNTLRELRGMALIGPLEVKGNRDGKPASCWYVGTEAYKGAAEYWFQHCVATADGQYDFRMKEMPRLYEAFGPGGGRWPIEGWWCVDAGENSNRQGSWAIFRDREDADNWLLGLGAR